MQEAQPSVRQAERTSAFLVTFAVCQRACSLLMLWHDGAIIRAIKLTNLTE